MSGVKKTVRKWIPKEIAPIAPLIAAPFLGPGAFGLAGLGLTGSALAGASALTGAGLGALTSDNSLKGALIGGATGGLAGGAGNAIAQGLGATGRTASAISRGLTGAAAGSRNGLKGALTGAALGGGSAYLPTSLGGAETNAGTFDMAGSGAGGSFLEGAGASGAGGNFLDVSSLNQAGTGAGGGAAASQGLMGAGSSAASDMAGAGIRGLLSKGISAYQASAAQDDIEEQLLAAQGRAQELIQPYADMGGRMTDRIEQGINDGTLGGSFNMQDFDADPGVDFQREQGEEALQRQLAAQGLSQSGSAIKEAMRFNQGLSNQEYNDAYQRFLNDQQNRYGVLAGQQGVGANAVGGLANTYINQGNISGNAALQKSNILSKALSGLFRPELEQNYF